MSLKDITAQEGVIAALISLLLGLAGLLGWRGSNKVSNENARDDRQSRFEDNLQARYDAEVKRNEELSKELLIVRSRLAEADKRLTVIQMMSDGDPKRAVEISQDSAFVDLSRPLRPRPQMQRRSSDDVFQAAEPYEPTRPKGPELELRMLDPGELKPKK